MQIMSESHFNASYTPMCDGAQPEILLIALWYD